MPDNQIILIAFGLTILAGLSTGIGSLIGFFAKNTNTKFLSIALGFSAGVMIYIALVDIFMKAKDLLIAELGATTGYWWTIAAFFGGIIFIAIIDRLIPNLENPHELHKIEHIKHGEQCSKYKNLYKTGVFVALAIAIHNFPEGIVTFTAALKVLNTGIAIAVAIAIHNIPEGIAVSVPIYFATKSKRKAFIYSFLSGVSEPVGALLGFILLKNFFSDTLFGMLFAAVAGIMVFISLDELLPAAREHGDHHLSIYGLIAGMAVMAVSLVLFV